MIFLLLLSLSLIFLSFLIFVYLVLFHERKGDPNWDYSYRFLKDEFLSQENTSDWQIYRNEEAGFEIKLPPGCEFKEEKEVSEKGFVNLRFSLNLDCFKSSLYLKKAKGTLDIYVYPKFNIRKDGERGFFNNNLVNIACDVKFVSYLFPEIKQPIGKIPVCYQNIGTYATYDYNFVRKNTGYRFVIWKLFQETPDQSLYLEEIPTEKAILQSFRFLD